MTHADADARVTSKTADVRKYAASLVWTKLASQTNRPVNTGYSKR
jgi:hypothetical protein